MNQRNSRHTPEGQPTPSHQTFERARYQDWINVTAVFLLLSLLATAIYSDTFSATFHYDDQQNIVDNPKIKQLENLLDFSGSRYVGILTFAVNYHFGRLNVFGYHLVNLVIHIINAFLVYLLVRLLYRVSHTPPLTPDASRLPAGQAGLTPAPWVALAAALLFTVHPIQTEAVTYIVQRFTSLATLFYLATVILYIHWRLTPPETKRRHLWYAGALCTTILGMKTKEITLTLPFMLLLVEAIFFGPLTRKSWVALIPFFLTLPIAPMSRPGALGEGEAGIARDQFALSRPDYLFTQFRVIVTYLRLLVFPVNQNLDYDYPAYDSLFDPQVFFSFLFLAALFALAIYLLLPSRLTPNASRLLTPFASRLMGFGILWFFLTLSIESSIIPIRDVIFEHRVYLPSVGFFLTAAVAALGLSDRWRIPKTITAALIIVVLAGVAYQRNKVWQDELTLWSDVVSKSPNKFRGYNNLGLAYADQEKWNEAIEKYKAAISINPTFADAHNDLGLAYKKLGQYDKAAQEYKTASIEKPDFDKPHNNLGIIYREQGKLNKALREFQTASILNPDYAEAHYNLGITYKDLGQLDKATRELKTALILNPDLAEAHQGLGMVYKEMGRLDEALTEYKKSLALNPNFAEAHNNIGNIYLAKGELDAAVREYQTATTLKPDYPLAQYNLGVVYFNQERLPDALLAFQKTVQINPDFAQAHNNLGIVFFKLGRLKEAIQEYEIAVKLKPDLADAHYNLGQAYQHMGRTREAIHAYEQALNIKPDDDKARQALKSLLR